MPAVNKTALVTGASGGIGYELAKLFAHDHYNLVLVARSGAKLAQLSDEMQRQFGITAKPMTADLAAPSAPEQLFEQLRKDGIEIDVLVNNAAYGKFGPFADMPLEEVTGQIELNIVGLTTVTRLFLPGMIARKSGRILNVASTAGFQPGPLMAVYYASKAYVLSFSEAIANELKGSGVTVTCLCPGPTDTGFQGRAGVENSRLFQQFGPMDAKTVARDGYHALMKGKTLTISGFKNLLLAESVRVAPRKLATAISRWVAEEKK
jgi:short-subunit dehydrogenase